MSYPGLELNGKTAVVIGGSSGIGRALAIGLAQAGADVIPSARRAQEVAAAASEIQRLGRRSLAVTCDVTSESSLQQLLQETLRAFDKVDILVNSAGIAKRLPTLELSNQDWDAILDINLKGVFHACKTFARHMVERRYGRIINIASLSSFLGLFQVAAYAASKGGVLSLTRTLAVEWAPHGVCVNAIMPGVFRTALNQKLLDGTPRGQEFLLRTPMKRFGQVEELVGAAIFLASDSAGFVTGATIPVDGGFLASGVNQ
ncbi:MAG TPA: glucose 1-dehydrogenase [Terriglobales bacterium]|jgi:NAD(P)-dependent dehydrogenase (short-subunit alcohol dehydrogenase family)|nr:glucose 1-dehydrogenase [Terriglobales bacterium]